MLLSNLNLLATAPGGVARLRELILTLAVQGKLVPQDTKDEPASVLLKKIRAEKDRLVAEGKIKRDRPLAEIAEEEKPFGLPRGWVWVRAIEICTLITDGDHLPPPKADSGIPFLVIGDVRDGFVDLQRVSRCVPTDYYDKLDWGKKPLLGDILYTTVGSFGIPVPIAMQQDFCFQRHIALFRPAIVDLQDCLALIFRSALIYQQAEAGATGIAQKTVPLSALRNLHIPLPPLAEQSRIVTRVEELMRLCDALEAKGQLEATQHAQLVSTLLGTLTESESPEVLADNWQRVATHFDLLLDRPEAVDALEQTILQLAVRGLLVPQDPQDEPASKLLKKIRVEKDRLIAAGKIKRDKPLPPITDDEKLFVLPKGWMWTRWADVAMKIGDIDHKMPSEEKDGIPYVSPRDFYGTNDIDFEGAKRISYSDYLDLSVKIRPELGDLIYPRYGTIGVVRKVVANREFLASYSCAVIKVLKDFIEPDYQYLFSVSRCAKEQAATATNKTTQPNVGLKSIQEFLVPLPPLAEQTRIVIRVSELRHLCDDLRQCLRSARERQSQFAQALVEHRAAATV